jgi:acetoacetyl-CoA synthetase
VVNTLFLLLELPTLEKVIVVPFIDQPFDLTGIEKAVSWTEFINSAPDEPLEFEQLPFNHPLAILYSSGTTGKPKCIVHSAGGMLIQHLKEHIIHGSMTREDVFFYYTTTGWMMWNWLVGGLSTGATIVLYDGSPFKPSPMRLWQLVDDFGYFPYLIKIE